MKNWLKALLAHDVSTVPINTLADFFEYTQVDQLGPMATILYPLVFWHVLVRLEFNLAEAPLQF